MENDAQRIRAGLQLRLRGNSPAAKHIVGFENRLIVEIDVGKRIEAIEDQVDVIVRGIRERWSTPDTFHGADPPPYAASTPGDTGRGAQVFATYCSSCHGDSGTGGKKAGSIVDGSFLALVSDQELRTIVIAGRPELGAPDWRDDVPGKPMSAQDISDVVAWLASQRPKYPGQPFPTTAKLMGETR